MMRGVPLRLRALGALLLCAPAALLGAAPKHRVVIADGGFRVDDEAFFPIGFYCAPICVLLSFPRCDHVGSSEHARALDLRIWCPCVTTSTRAPRAARVPPPVHGMFRFRSLSASTALRSDIWSMSAPTTGGFPPRTDMQVSRGVATTYR